MTHFFKKSTPIFILIFVCVSSGVTQKKNDNWMFNPKVKLDQKEYKEEFRRVWERSHKVMAGSDKIDSATYFSKVDSVLSSYNQDSITMTELVKLYRGVLDLFTLEDPHFRVYPLFFRNSSNKDAMRKGYEKFIKILPCNLLQINDSLIVDTSIDKNLQKGDIVLKINGVGAKKLLDYTYRDRYVDTYMMMIQNNLMFKNSYHVQLIRNGKPLDLKIAGTTLKNYQKSLIEDRISEKIYGNIGYFAINEFDRNSFIIKQLRKLIKEVKAVGGKNIIIDLRKNGGGNGQDFDKLFSIFTLRSKIDYLKSVKVKISEKTISDYGYADSIGKMVVLPDSEIIKEIPLQSKLYMGKMTYYVLISRNTGSMAASFANIIQCNNLGFLVGEPMCHNATRYGEVVEGYASTNYVTYSTLEYDENTKAVNGVIEPDISIPYIAEEYAEGGDPILEKLLEIIKSNRNKKVNLEN